jgi:hypothetical protein
MYKFLCKAEIFNEKQRIVKTFEENSVKYRVKSCGPNIFQKAGYENKCYWFKIYVNKSDFEKAERLLGLNM